jgi:hypothetical protein
MAFIAEKWKHLDAESKKVCHYFVNFCFWIIYRMRGGCRHLRNVRKRFDLMRSKNLRHPVVPLQLS